MTNTIGLTDPGDPNIIAGNGKAGVVVTGDTARYNTIRGK